LGSNPGLRCERPATNRLSYGTAKTIEAVDKRKSVIKICTTVMWL
jgi:hypothetical protein